MLNKQVLRKIFINIQKLVLLDIPVVIMILSRAKPAISTTGNDAESSAAALQAQKKIPTLEKFLTDRDYTGAMSLLDFQRNSGKGSANVNLWLAYSAFHAGEYKRAMHEYEAMRDEGMKGWSKAAIRDTLINLACCYFYLGMYTESEKVGLFCS